MRRDAKRQKALNERLVAEAREAAAARIAAGKKKKKRKDLFLLTV